MPGGLLINGRNVAGDNSEPQALKRELKSLLAARLKSCPSLFSHYHFCLLEWNRLGSIFGDQFNPQINSSSINSIPINSLPNINSCRSQFTSACRYSVHL